MIKLKEVKKRICMYFELVLELNSEGLDSNGNEIAPLMFWRGDVLLFFTILSKCRNGLINTVTNKYF